MENPFVHANSYLCYFNVSISVNGKNFRLKLRWFITCTRQILMQMQTGVTLIKISESKNHFQCNSQPNTERLGRWRTKNFSVSKMIKWRVFVNLQKRFDSNSLHQIRRWSHSLEWLTKIPVSKFRINQKSMFDEKTHLMQWPVVRRNPDNSRFPRTPGLSC